MDHRLVRLRQALHQFGHATDSPTDDRHLLEPAADRHRVVTFDPQHQQADLRLPVVAVGNTPSRKDIEAPAGKFRLQGLVPREIDLLRQSLRPGIGCGNECLRDVRLTAGPVAPVIGRFADPQLDGRAPHIGPVSRGTIGLQQLL